MKKRSAKPSRSDWLNAVYATQNMKYEFEWDRKKAASNFRKHGISFERATGVFRDPNLLSIPDIEHSLDEERWVTMGHDAFANLLVLVHTFESSVGNSVRIRIISVRKATKREKAIYEEGI